MKYKIVMMIGISLSTIYASQELNQPVVSALEQSAYPNNAFAVETVSDIIADQTDALDANKLITFEDRYPDLSNMYQVLGLDFKADFISKMRALHNADMENNEIVVEPKHLDAFIEFAHKKILDNLVVHETFKHEFLTILQNIIENNQDIDDIDDPLFLHLLSEDYLRPVLVEYVKFSNQNNELMEDAVEHDNVSVVQFLLDHGVDVNSTNKRHQTALHQAARYGSEKTLRLLIQSGADVNAHTKKYNSENKIQRYKHWQVPLHFAVLPKENGNQYLITELLLQAGADPNAVDQGLQTPLHYASEHNEDRIIDLLIRFGALVHAKDILEETALHHAAENNADRAINLLLAQGLDVNPSIRNRCAPLYHAAKNGGVEAVRLLLDAGADVNFINESKSTALHAAAAINSDIIVSLLLAAGADRNKKNAFGKTALQVAQGSKADKVIPLLL